MTELIDLASDEFYQEEKPRGLMDASAIGHLDQNVDDEEILKSGWYTYSRTKAGHLAVKGNDAVEHDEFATILRYTEHKVATMIDQLANGHIDPNPYRAAGEIPCNRCDFIAVCPFDRINGDFRELPRMKNEEVLAAMQGELSRR